MQEVAGEQGAAYIPMPKGRGFTPHFDNYLLDLISAFSSAVIHPRETALFSPNSVSRPSRYNFLIVKYIAFI